MESDLRTSPARLRVGLHNLSATPPDPRARPLPRAKASRLRPLGTLLTAHAGSDPSSPEPDPPCLRQLQAKAGQRRPYQLRRKQEPLACWPHRYAKLPRRAWDDPRLHRGAVLTLAVILCTARGRRQFHTYTRSLAADARVCERTMHNHLKLLEAAGYIALWRATRRGPLLVRIADPALVQHRPLPAWAEAGWALMRSRHSKAADALAAADRRFRWAHRVIGLGAVGIAIPTPRILLDPESRSSGGLGRMPARRECGSAA